MSEHIAPIRNGINCNVCGRFIRYQDIADGKALHTMTTPDSEYTWEEWDSLCAKCYAPELQRMNRTTTESGL